MLKVIDTAENKTIGVVVSRKSADRIVAKHMARTGSPASRFLVQDVHVSSSDHKTSQIA